MSFRTERLFFWIIIAAISVAVFLADDGLGIFRKSVPITDEQKNELLKTFDEESQRIWMSPPNCWGYKGPRHEAIGMDAIKRRDNLWLESIGRKPPLTCAEYENSN